MSGIASGVTSFVLGRDEDGNREMYTFKDGQAYDLDFEDATAYTADETEFPVIV
jgi:hypothetical protein